MPTNARLTPKLRKAVRWLRKHFPVRTPVIVRVHATMPGFHGLCIFEEKRALIRITNDKDSVMVESLIEEWCHVLRSECPLPETNDHDALFWAIYGAVSMKWRGE